MAVEEHTREEQYQEGGGRSPKLSWQQKLNLAAASLLQYLIRSVALNITVVVHQIINDSKCFCKVFDPNVAGVAYCCIVLNSCAYFVAHLYPFADF